MSLLRAGRWISGVALALLAGVYVRALVYTPVEASQGPAQKIFYLHVPSAIWAETAMVLVGLASIVYLFTKDLRLDRFAAASAEVGTVFCAIVLTTGPIWGKPIWGTWWTWDARLTWALISWLIYAGYLMLRDAVDEPTARARNSSVLSIFALATVLITYKAIDWWRTQHPGPVLSIRGADGRMDPAMERMLYLNWIPMLLLAGVFLLIRMRQEQTQREIEALRRYAHSY